MKLAFKFDNGRVVSHEVFERTFTIGRSEKCRVSLDNEGFSREHCLIELVDGVIYVSDLGSKNGVFINHVKIPQKLRVSYDTKYPLYIGAAFLTIDASKDSKDPDHLSLQTYSRIDPGPLYKTLSPPPRPAKNLAKPLPVKGVMKNAEKNSRGYSLVVAVVLIAAIVIYLNRESMKGHTQATDQHK